MPYYIDVIICLIDVLLYKSLKVSMNNYFSATVTCDLISIVIVEGLVLIYKTVISLFPWHFLIPLWPLIICLFLLIVLRIFYPYHYKRISGIVLLIKMLKYSQLLSLFLIGFSSLLHFPSVLVSSRYFTSDVFSSW